MKINVTALQKSYGSRKIIENLNLELHNFKSLSVMGPSGGGKSTFIRLLAGLEAPTAGEIFIDGQGLASTHLSRAPFDKKKIGVVFQSFNLFPHLNAIENILLPLTKVHRLDSHEARVRAEGLLRRFKLLDEAQKSPSELSGGQCQRIAILRAVAGEPQLLLLDEPTSALDSEMRLEVLRLILELKDQGISMIVATHELDFAKRFSDEVLYLQPERAVGPLKWKEAEDNAGIGSFFSGFRL